MSNKLTDLSPVALIRAKYALADLEEKGIPYAVTSTLRTVEEQQAYYAQGRMSLVEVNNLRRIAGFQDIAQHDNSYVITNCDGVKKKSIHQSGNALDVVPTFEGRPDWPSKDDPRWLQIAECFEVHNFEWGGRWKDFPDYPHYQMKN